MTLQLGYLDFNQPVLVEDILFCLGLFISWVFWSYEHCFWFISGLLYDIFNARKLNFGSFEHSHVNDWKFNHLFLNLFSFLFSFLFSKTERNGWWFVQVLTGLTDAQLENLDMIEGDEYERKTVEVVLTVSFTS